MVMELESSFKKRMRTIVPPEGFVGGFGSEPREGVRSSGSRAWELEMRTHWYYKLVKPDDIELKFDQNGRGHTRFKVGESWFSFDRTGVEDSFYHVPLYDGDTKKDLNAIIAEQISRVAKRREYYGTAVKVPGLPGGWTIAPNAIADLKARLQKLHHITFTPSGFGTGYMVTTKPVRNLRYGETRAKKELETFLGHSPLYVSTMDCD